jgi:hypothetical protein
MNTLKRFLLGLAALLIAGAVWIPCLHLIFTRSAANSYQPQSISPRARELANYHLRLWTDPKLRELELGKMRASNAEWDFMGRSFLVWSLANMGLREPSSQAAYLQTIDQIIDETLQLEKQEGMFFFLMPYAKAAPYAKQPAHSLFLDGEIALMLGARRAVAEKAEYKTLLTERVEAITARFRQSPNLVLESYPDECWMFDHVVALAGLRLADQLDGSDHSALVRDWIAMARKHLVHAESGLLISSFTTDRQHLDGPEGSSILTGTAGSTNLGWGTCAFLGLTYIVAYLAFVLLAPSLLLAAGLLVLWRRWRARGSRS